MRSLLHYGKQLYNEIDAMEAQIFLALCCVVRAFFPAFFQTTVPTFGYGEALGLPHPLRLCELITLIRSARVARVARLHHWQSFEPAEPTAAVVEAAVAEAAAAGAVVEAVAMQGGQGVTATN